MCEKTDVLIIGGGLGGLLSALLLSKKGLKVCVAEKNSAIGGMIQPFVRNKVMFDTGMNFFGAYKEGQIQNKLFKIFGIDDIEISDIPFFKFVFNNKVYKIPNNPDFFFDYMSEYFPEEKGNMVKYIDTINEIYGSLTFENLYKREFNKFNEKSAEFFLNETIKNNDLKEILKYNGLLSGYLPDKTSLYLYGIITGTFMQSAGMFSGGTKYFLNKVSEKIKLNGGEIITKKELVKAETENDKIKRCIFKDGTIITAKKYLSTISPQILLTLIDGKLLKSFYKKRILNLPVSKGSFIINVKMKKNKFPYYDSPVIINSSKHYLFYTPASGKNGNYADTVKIMTDDNYFEYKDFFNTKTGKRGEKYILLITEKAKNIFKVTDKVIPHFSENIQNYYISTPLTFRDYTATPQGSSYGIIHDFNNPENSFIPVYTKFKNLFLAGQNINFHGMTGVSVTSLIASSAILEQEIYD